jgi:tetratricopeptide (TPR) repeat protein
MTTSHLIKSIAPNVSDDEADKLCSLCGYLPLAIRAVANRLAETKGLISGSYIDRLSDNKKRLDEIGERGVEIGVKESLNKSYLHIDKESALLFRLLALFTGPFEAKAEELVCEDAGSSRLNYLVSRNLVCYSDQTDRYQLHNLTWIFAYALLENETESYQAAKRHAAYYLDIARRANGVYLQGGDSVKQGLELFDSEWANIEAAMKWAGLNSKDDDEAAAYCSEYIKASIDLLDLRVEPRRRLFWLNLAAKAAWRLKDRMAEGLHINSVGSAYLQMGEAARAMKFYQNALEILRSIGNSQGEGIVTFNMGKVYADTGNFQQSVQLYKTALSILQEYKDIRTEAAVSASMGMALYLLDEKQGAINSCEKALALAMEIGDLRIQCEALAALGYAFSGNNETAQAISTYEKALSIADELGHRQCQATVLGNLGEIYAEQNQTDLALDCFNRQLALAERTLVRP